MQVFLQRKSNKYNIFWVCICSLRYPACNAHTPYCHLYHACLCKIFPHHLIKGKIFGKKLLNTKCVFWFSLRFCHTFLILRRILRNKNKMHAAPHVAPLMFPLTYNSRHSCHVLIKLQLLLQIFEKYSNVKFHENPSSGSRVVPCGVP